MEKEVKNTGKNTGIENLKPWKAGDPSPNPNGRPKGQRNYATIYKEALIKLGEINNKTPEELENELVASGFVQAKKDYRFYKDIQDRLHGQATQKSETSIVFPNIEIAEAIANKYDITRSTKQNS